MDAKIPSELQNKPTFFYGVSLLLGFLFFLISIFLYSNQTSVWLILLVDAVIVASLLSCFTFLYHKKIQRIQNNHQKDLSILRHDVKGILSPALLMADRILLNKSADEKTIQSAESIAQSIEKVAEYLKETKK